ncbi:MAG: hypothetical protein VX597_00260, partial [Pseudomonadota bacterium]|nr:hypothetical protein [Pseudomonadota bacterium]
MANTPPTNTGGIHRLGASRAGDGSSQELLVSNFVSGYDTEQPPSQLGIAVHSASEGFYYSTDGKVTWSQMNSGHLGEGFLLLGPDVAIKFDTTAVSEGDHRVGYFIWDGSDGYSSGSLISKSNFSGFGGSFNTLSSGEAALEVSVAAPLIDKPPIGEISVTGKFLEGEVLTISENFEDYDGIPAAVDVAGISPGQPKTYQWYKDGEPIEGQKDPTYVISASDVGSAISASVSFTDNLGFAYTYESTNNLVAAATPATTPAANEGIVEWGSSSFDDEGRGVVIQSDGKIVVAGTSYDEQGVDRSFTVIRYNVDGTLDQSFGNGGVALTDFPGDVSLTVGGGGILLQPDGKILVAGRSSQDTTGSDFSVLRYNTDGTLDASFGTGGVVTTAVGPGYDKAHGLALQSDGSIVVVGLSYDQMSYAGISGSPTVDEFFALARYDVNGILDTSFGSDGTGTVRTNLDPVSVDRAFNVEILNDGKIVIGGYSGYDSDADFALLRFNPDGTADSSFGTGGVVTTDINGHRDRGFSFEVDADGKIILAGMTRSGDFATGYDFCLVRYNGDGSLDSSFGTGGKVVSDLGSTQDVALVVALQPDGKILLGGESEVNDTDPGFTLARYNSDGSLDTSFSGDGFTRTDISPAGEERIYDISVQSDGKIVVTGRAENDQSNTDIVLARYNADGTRDTSFGVASKAPDNITLKGPHEYSDLGSGDDWFLGTSESDYVTTGGGSDDVVTGGGDDVVVVETGSSSDVVSVDTGSGSDRVVVESGFNGTLFLRSGPGSNALEFNGFDIENTDGSFDAAGKLTITLESGAEIYVEGQLSYDDVSGMWRTSESGMETFRFDQFDDAGVSTGNYEYVLGGT